MLLILGVDAEGSGSVAEAEGVILGSLSRYVYCLNFNVSLLVVIFKM